MRIVNTDHDTHHVIRLELMLINNTGYAVESSPALDFRLMNDYVLIRNCLFSGITATNSHIISATFDSETTSRVSVAKLAQNSVVLCTGGGVIFINNIGENNATLSMTKNDIRHNYAYESHSIIQLVNMTVAMRDNMIYNNSGKYALEIGSETLGCNQLPVQADGNLFWSNAALKRGAKYTVSLNASNVRFTKNIFNNPSNTYEISVREMGIVNATDASVDCRNNWWGFVLPHFHRIRIRDGRTIEDLAVVESSPFETAPPSGLHFSGKHFTFIPHKY